jgi:hypothetical protein
LSALAGSVSQALSSEGSEALADSEIHSLIENHVRDMMYESQNLEERNYLMQSVSKQLESLVVIMTTLFLYII